MSNLNKKNKETESMEYGIKNLMDITLHTLEEINNRDENFENLFIYEDYKNIFKNNMNSYMNSHPSLDYISHKQLSIENIAMKETELSVILNNQYSRLNMNLNDEVSQICKNNHTKIFFNDFENLPFDRFFLNMQSFDGVENVYVHKTECKIFIHIIGVGKEKISFQKVIDNSGVNDRKTLLYNCYNEYISTVSSETHRIIEDCFNYVISVLTFIKQFQYDKKVIEKNMGYDNFLNSHNVNKKIKFKLKKKLNSKKNTITIKLVENGVKYLNSILKDTQYTKPTAPVFVVGHFRNQPIGKKELGLTQRIWIKPFFKYVEQSNNDNYKTKIYQVS